MFCKNCGNEVNDKAVICVKCGVPIKNEFFVSSEVISNHIAFAVITTLFCCMPFGIIAIVYSSQVNTKVALGDLEGARLASEKSKKWCIVALCSGIVVGIIYFILTLIEEM